MASGIQKHSDDRFSIRFKHQNDCLLQPTLIIEPFDGASIPSTADIEADKTRENRTSSFSSSKFRIRVLLAADSELFPIEKTLPWKNCIRPGGDHANEKVDSIGPTPLYNGTLRADVSTAPYLKLLDVASKQILEFRQACILARIWLRQRGFGASLHKGGFGVFEAASIIALLNRGGGRYGKPSLSTRLDGFQLFKAFLHFIASRDLIREPMVIEESGKETSNSLKLETPNFFHGATGHNILYKMTKWSYKRVGHKETRKYDRSLC
jgi:U3 small nucleolar RNA-associated protein 22